MISENILHILTAISAFIFGFEEEHPHKKKIIVELPSVKEKISYTKLKNTELEPRRYKIQENFEERFNKPKESRFAAIAIKASHVKSELSNRAKGELELNLITRPDENVYKGFLSKSPLRQPIVLFNSLKSNFKEKLHWPIYTVSTHDIYIRDFPLRVLVSQEKGEKSIINKVNKIEALVNPSIQQKLKTLENKRDNFGQLDRGLQGAHEDKKLEPAKCSGPQQASITSIENADIKNKGAAFITVAQSQQWCSNRPELALTGDTTSLKAEYTPSKASKKPHQDKKSGLMLLSKTLTRGGLSSINTPQQRLMLVQKTGQGSDEKVHKVVYISLACNIPVIVKMNRRIAFNQNNFWSSLLGDIQTFARSSLQPILKLKAALSLAKFEKPMMGKGVNLKPLGLANLVLNKEEEKLISYSNVAELIQAPLAEEELHNKIRLKGQEKVDINLTIAALEEGIRKEKFNIELQEEMRLKVKFKVDEKNVINLQMAALEEAINNEGIPKFYEWRKKRRISEKSREILSLKEQVKGIDEEIQASSTLEEKEINKKKVGINKMVQHIASLEEKKKELEREIERFTDRIKNNGRQDHERDCHIWKEFAKPEAFPLRDDCEPFPHGF